MKKMLSILLLGFVMVLCFGIGINFYISYQKDFPNEMCWKNRFLVKIGDEGSIYTKIKHITCEVQRGIIILEYTNE